MLVHVLLDLAIFDVIPIRDGNNGSVEKIMIIWMLSFEQKKKRLVTQSTH